MAHLAAAVFYLLVLYKFPNIIECWDLMTPYPVFPWMEVASAQISSSPYWWLAIHNFQVLLHLDLTLLVPNKSVTYWYYSHWLFLILLAPNIHHFGEFSHWQAILLNGTLG